MKLILGSKSPRRKELLSGMGFTFEVRTKDTDETYPDDLPVTQIASYIAFKKANALLETLKDEELLICADTTVILENIHYSKPVSEEECKQMLRTFSGKTHQVITGVCIVGKAMEPIEFSVCTDVCFAILTEEEIAHYITTYKPYDKAGGYGIQEWIGYNAIKEIKGSYTNVVGLPTHEVYSALKAIKQKMAG